MSRTISLGTKRSGVEVAIHSSLVRLRAVFVQVFLVIVYFDVILWLLRFSTDEEAAVGKQHCERLGAYEQGLFVSLFTIKFFFFLIKTHRERGGSNPSSRPLPFALSHFCDKMFNVFLKKMSFFFFGLVRGRPFVRLNHQTVVVVFLLCSFIVIIVAHAQFLHFFSWLYSSLILNWSNLLNFMVAITRSPPYL